MYVITDGRLETRTVEVSAFEGADVVVTAGLADGDRVLTTRMSNVEAGLRVTVPGAEPVAPEGGGPPVAQGRPSPEMIAAAKRISGLSDAEWSALSREERRPFVRRAREQAGGAQGG